MSILDLAQGARRKRTNHKRARMQRRSLTQRNCMSSSRLYPGTLNFHQCSESLFETCAPEDVRIDKSQHPREWLRCRCYHCLNPTSRESELHRLLGRHPDWRYVNHRMKTVILGETCCVSEGMGGAFCIKSKASIENAEEDTGISNRGC